MAFAVIYKYIYFKNVQSQKQTFFGFKSSQEFGEL